jgi:predicted TIM-barrel fold metal-dependent hydrolase
MTVYAKCGDDGRWRIWVRSEAGESVAGIRLNWGGEFPHETICDHQDHAEATLQAGRLQEYLDDRERVLMANRKKKQRWQ